MFIHLLNREREFLFENENVFGISRGTINESPEDSESSSSDGCFMKNHKWIWLKKSSFRENYRLASKTSQMEMRT